jgi:hypothetical protein
MDHYFLTLINGGDPLCTIQRLKAKCDEALSTFAFKFNSRRYIKDPATRAGTIAFVSKLARDSDTHVQIRGRGSHSFTSQLNPSRF